MNQPLVEPPWPASIAAYLMLMGAAAGISLLPRMIRARGTTADVFERISASCALFLMLFSGIILIVDLGQPLRFFLMITEFTNLGSPMSIGAKLIAAKTFLLAVYLYLLRGKREIHAAIPALLAMVSFALAIYPVALLSRTWMSPLTSGSGATAIFLATALLLGASMGLLLASAVESVAADLAFTTRIVRMLLVLLAAESVLLLFEGYSLRGRTGALSGLLAEIMYGRAAGLVWGVIVAVGLVLPAIGLLCFPRSRHAAVTSALAVIVGACATRYLYFSLR